MAAMVSFVALALAAVCVTADDYASTTVTITSSPVPSLPYYPVDSPAYNDLKRNLYLMNQALGSVVFNAQNYYDYYSLYKYSNPALYQTDYNGALSKLLSADNYLTSTYNDYQRSLNAYKNSLNPAVVPPLADNVPVNPMLYTNPY